MGRALFPVFSLLNHDCVPNATYVVEELRPDPDTVRPKAGARNLGQIYY